MHIRQLARNAALITVAAIVTAAFSTGIAQATNAAPASTVSAVTPSGSMTPMMPAGCNPPAFCTYASSIHGLILLQRIPCQNVAAHNAIDGDVIYEMVNACPQYVDYEFINNTWGCINGHSTKIRSGNFYPIKYFDIELPGNCP